MTPAPIDDDVLFAGVAALSARLRDRALSPVELVEACLARIDALAPGLGCFVTVTAERARRDAREAEAEIAAGRWRGPLHGIPYGLKDVIDTAGIPTTFGARPYAARIPERDATIAARLADAGAVLVGKLSTVELAGGLGYRSAASAVNGPCRTPWDLSRWAGGSSSGPAAAVAAGLVPFAIGTESWGSLTCPAAFCGVTALRPTYGVLSRHGTMTLSYSMDKIGPVARSAEDCALVLSVLAGVDPRDPTSIPPPAGVGRARPAIPRGLRLGVLDLADGRGPRPLPGAPEALALARDLLGAAGAILEPAALPAIPYEAAATIVLEAEAANAFEALVRSGRTRELADPSHRGRVPADYVPRATSADYVRATRIRTEAQRALARLFERHDLVLAPNLPVAPPRVDEPLTSLWSVADPLGAAGNLAGLPAVALPMGFSGGLPLSMQLVAPPLEEARLLSAAMAFQARTSHHRQRPPAPAAAAVAAAPPRGSAGSSASP
jgi:aspartyl-tRNA(Asn)/glutamyl-tRNA(Gln) amidotransferase subunit A